MTFTPKDSLLPCPFCGGFAYVNYSDRGELFGVRCNHWHGNGGSVKCMGAGAYADTEDEAITAWNTRSDKAATDRLLAMLDDEEVVAEVTHRLESEALAAAKGDQRYTEAGAFTSRLAKAALSAIKQRLGAV